LKLKKKIEKLIPFKDGYPNCKSDEISGVISTVFP
jgi:hypothetical protein